MEQRPLRGAGETLFWLPAVATLVAGDRLIGDGAGGLQVCPESWLTGVRVDRAEVAGLLRELLELPIERVLVSHGEPVLRQGHAALGTRDRRGRRRLTLGRRAAWAPRVACWPVRRARRRGVA